MNPLWGIVLVSVISPAVMAVLTHLLRRSERREDYARQDAVAAKVDAAARQQAQAATKVEAVAVQAAEAASLLVDSNERVAESTTRVDEKLNVIHALVNSNLTAAMRNELDATTRELALLRELIALHEAAGRRPTVDTLATVEATEAKIVELSAVVSDRVEQQAEAEQAEPQAFGV